MSNFNLLVNNNKTFCNFGLNIYGSDIVTYSYALIMNPSPPTENAQNRPPNQDYNISLESPQKSPPEDSCKISVNKNKKKKNQPTVLSLTGYKVNQIQTKKMPRAPGKNRRFFCGDDRI